MRVNFAMTGINHQPFKVRGINQNFKQPFPYPIVAPADKAPMSITPATEVGRQIPPRRTRSHNPKNCVYKTAVVMGNTALVRAMIEATPLP